MAWYYRPLGIALLTLTALGPFGLLLVWRSPRLGQAAKWIASLLIVIVSVYVAWEFVIALQQFE